MRKIPQVVLLYWIMKTIGTTLGETGGDAFSMTMNLGYLASSFIFFALFVITLAAQLISKKYVPSFFWMLILTTSLVGTTMSDFMDRTLGLGYATGSAILVGILCAIFGLWYFSERTLHINDIKSLKAECFYWCAVLVSNTLGTALGDFLADNSGLGFGGSFVLVSVTLAVIAALYFFTKMNRVLLFWLAFVLTRPFGASGGDILTKDVSKGGIGLGTYGSSAILGGALVILVIYATIKNNKDTQAA